LQRQAYDLAVCILWHHGCLLFNETDADPSLAVYQVLFPVYNSDLVLVLLHVVCSVCVGKRAGVAIVGPY
jgi:hypothetical protein